MHKKVLCYEEVVDISNLNSNSNDVIPKQKGFDQSTIVDLLSINEFENIPQMFSNQQIVELLDRENPVFDNKYYLETNSIKFKIKTENTRLEIMEIYRKLHECEDRGQDSQTAKYNEFALNENQQIETKSYTTEFLTSSTKDISFGVRFVNLIFGVEVPQLMSMFVNSVYSSKDLFLREAISNASDAITKMYESKASLDADGYKTIEVIPDVKNNCLIIRDNGIGMTKEDLKNYLGSIAASGTGKFRELMNSTNKQKMEDLIGQFGLGFYSLFLVADRVDVITKNPRDSSYLWTSEEYEFDGLHGTSIVLHLKEGEGEFLKTDVLTKLIKKHSMYIRYPIALHVEKEIEVAEEEEKPKVDEEEEAPNNDNQPEVTEVKEDAEVKKTKKKITEMQIINSDISVWKKKAKMSFFEKPTEKATNFKIYNNNVFITDSLPRDIVPEWMSFVVGAVTSSDFSLNISREFLQVRETSDNIQKTFAQFLMYPTNKDSKLTSLDGYCKQIDESDKQILYLTGLNQKDVENSLYLDAFKDRTVLLMSDASDEIMLQGFKNYNGLTFQNISAEGVDMVSSDVDTTFDEFGEYCQKLLENSTEKVIFSKRFQTVPASILTTKHSHSSTMEAIMRSHPNAENDLMMQMMLKSKKIFEMNSGNIFVNNLKALYDEKKLKKVDEYVKFLYDATAVGCGNQAQVSVTEVADEDLKGEAEVQEVKDE
ncbi:unnamed protein product [Medioppia subpectinata]|uniref:Heat shock protein 90 n=1 Tax=Medioppia subpectinata TaxID=1979941 RepID=A0A7R9KDU9_9ACAR|nr:unnamed protein product [Medioppia subpectinata]CAG2100734.1 unnamed protein product [Medioppia subpectinata]